MLDKENIQFMYNKKGLSASEIARIHKTSVWRVISFMRRNNIKRRKPSETLNIQFEKKPLTFKKKQRLSKRETDLFIAGLFLYWAEGSKTNSHTVDLANSNLKMISIFLKMLRTIYGIKEGKLRVYIYCFANQKTEELINYWSSRLGISKTQFSKPYVRKDFDISKTSRMPYGLVHIRYNDKKLLRQILADIDIIAFSILN